MGTIAVIGGRGVIGSAIVDRLRRDGLDVVVVTHSREIGRLPGYRFGDILQPRTLELAVDGAEVVIQTANFKSYPMERRKHGQTFAAFDAKGTESLVAAAEAVGARRYVFVSGAGARSGVDQPYWRALALGEQAVLGARMEGVCVEPTLVFGPRDRGLNRILALARKTHVVPLVGAGEELHQPVFVDDVAELVRQAITRSSPQGVFSIGGPERLSMKNLLRCTLRLAGVRCRICHVPVAVARNGARILQNMPGELLSTAAIDFICEDFVADMERTHTAFLLASTTLEAGMGTYLARPGGSPPLRRVKR